MAVAVRELVTKWGFQIDQSALDKLNKGIDNVKGSLIAIGTAAVAAAGSLFGIAKITANVGDNAAKSARMIGLTAEALQEYQFAASISGVGSQEMSMALLRLSRAASDSQQGMETYARAFRALDIDVENSDKTLKSSEQLLLELADALKGMTDKTRRAAIMQELMGRSGAKMTTFMLAGSEGIRALREEARKSGFVLSEEATEAAESFNDQLNRMISVLKGLVFQLGVRLFPIIQPVVDHIREFALANRQVIAEGMNEFVKTLLMLLKSMTAKIKIAVMMFKSFAAIVGGVANLMKILVATFSIFLGLKLAIGIGQIAQATFLLAKGLKLATIWGAVLAALPALLIAGFLIFFALLIDDIMAYFQGRDSVVGLIGDAIARGIIWMQEPFIRFWEWLKGGFQDIANFIGDMFKKMLDPLKETFETATRIAGKIGKFFGFGGGQSAEMAFGQTGSAPQAAAAVGAGGNMSVDNTLNVNVQGLPPDVAERVAQTSMTEGWENILRETARSAEPAIER